MITIRPETSADVEPIGTITTDAFARAPHASGTEAAIVSGLRDAGALTLSLVAEEDGAVVGHVAFSAVRVDGRDVGWLALGPIAVRPDRQGRGIGAALVREGLARVRAAGARGVVLVGDPAYYGRFGFQADPGLAMPGVPARYVLAHALEGAMPAGTLSHRDAFATAGA
ncbi:GNAT family N-acetyltransferase [Salinarimonas chemoclinalis]|uniref:GNAT family N-acetyltransferase n=1 Tax=Salinarimonas chemoclinalis TaxID=3241599 RepID=UPI00355862F0